METIKLKPVVKDYAWGNKDFIPSLVGGYTGGPLAELWMGTHPSGESYIEGNGKLSKYLESHPDLVGGDRLPLLFKVLAIASPLSLQCHPNLEMAKEGWKKEEENRKKGLPCNYQDDNQKEEVIAALSPITAMCGFRELSVIEENLEGVVPSSFKRYLSSFRTIKELFFGLYSLSVEDKDIILEELRESLDKSPESSWNGNFLTEKGIALRCLDIYSGDIGALFPYILNVVHLQIGEALYLRPGTLHAYVYGNGIELMSASDNVLRGGLTGKRIDLAELANVMDFSSTSTNKASYSYDSFGRRVYQTPSNTFRLLEMSSGEYEITNNSAMLMLITEGKVRLREGSDSSILEKGSILLIPKTLKHYTLSIHGEIFLAEVI